MFNPANGQWTTEDPIDFDADDPNLRRFVHNNATNMVDRAGLEKAPTSFKIPEDVREKASELWRMTLESGENEKASEFGQLIIRTVDMKKRFSPIIKGTSNRLEFDPTEVKKGEELIGSIHTHPSAANRKKDDPPPVGIPFSDTDIDAIFKAKERESYVVSGDSLFLLLRFDSKEADNKARPGDWIKEEYDKQFKRFKETTKPSRFEYRSRFAAMMTIQDTGYAMYEAVKKAGSRNYPEEAKLLVLKKTTFGGFPIPDDQDPD